MTRLIHLPDTFQHLLFYVVESGLLLGLSLLYYALILLPARNWKFNRGFLLLAPLVGLLLPLIQWSEALPAALSVPLLFTLDVLTINSLSSDMSVHAVDWLGRLYGIAAGLMLLRMLVHLGQIWWLIRRHPHTQGPSYTLVRVQPGMAIASFASYIFWAPRPMWSPQEAEQILSHEICHVRQRHSLDLLFVEALLILAWCQPLLWVLRRAIRQNHEFLADQAALRQSDPKTYAHILLTQVFGRPLRLVHSFHHSPLTKRIMMLHPIAGLPQARRKAWLALPILALCLMAVSCTLSETEAASLVTAPGAPEIEALSQVDLMPVPLNMAAIQREIGYPKSARTARIEGQVVLRILVGTEGEYIRHEVVKGAEKQRLVDAVEANIKHLAFTPAQQDQQPVKSWVNIPFNFKLLD